VATSTVEGTPATVGVGTVSLVEGVDDADGIVVTDGVVDVDAGDVDAGDVDDDEHAAMAMVPASATHATDQRERAGMWVRSRRSVVAVRVMVMGVLRGLAVDDSRRGGRHHSRPIGAGCRPATG
jgi:hypothetical protein